MSRRALAFSLCALFVLGGCGRAGPAARKLCRRLLRKGKVVRKLPKPKRPAPRVAPSASGHASDVGRRVGRSVARSRSVGDRLTALRPKIPPHVYSRLWAEWQRNAAELRSYQRQLRDPDLDPARRARIEEAAEELDRRNDEIERLAEEYG